MSFLSVAKAFFSAPKVVDNVFDKEKGLLTQFGGWVNDLNYTDQEKAQALGSLLDHATQFAKDTLGESTERSKTRRSLAIEIMRVELSLILMSVAVWPINKEYARFIWDVASSTLVAGAFGAVVVFFFGTYGIGTHIVKNLSDRQQK